MTVRQGGTGAAALALLVVAAAVILCGPLDARLDETIEGWRTCSGVALAGRVSDLVMPVGLSAVAIALARSLWRGRPRPLEVLQIVAALAAGVLLVGALKDFLDRPRPGAEFLGPGGGSYPSGHVANTVLAGLAALTLWWGGWPLRISWRGWLLLGVALAIVGAARVYGRRHWPSDAVGSLAIGGAFGLLAILQPDARWRTATMGIGLLLAGLTHVAALHGIKVRIPASTGRAAPSPSPTSPSVGRARTGCCAATGCPTRRIRNVAAHGCTRSRVSCSCLPRSAPSRSCDSSRGHAATCRPRAASGSASS